MAENASLVEGVAEGDRAAIDHQIARPLGESDCFIRWRLVPDSIGGAVE